MTNFIGAPTLNCALSALTKVVEKGESAGEKITVFCEDKLTLLAERAAVAHSKGTFSTEVTTFARFLKGDRALLSKEGSVMAVSSILARNTLLRCFKKSDARAVYETIAQLLSSRADAATLRKSAEETEGMLSRKLSDLAFVLEKYQQFLDEKGLLDENGYLALLPGKIGGTLGDSHIVFFAFPSFTRQAAEGVRAAVMNGRKVTGIFLAGKGGAYTNEAAKIFLSVAKEAGEIGETFCASDLKDDAAFLAHGLFSPEIYGKKAEKREHIHLFRPQDEGDEAETVCALIKKHMAEDGLRYRDFAVLLPDKERFPQIERMFAGYRIPFFSDRKRPFSEHPFCRFALDVLACVYDGGQPDSVDAVLSSCYFGQADDYRNYLLKYGGYRGAVNREIKDGDAVKGYRREELVAARDKIRAVLSLFPREGKGKKFISGVRALYELTDGDAVTQKLTDKFAGVEREFLDIAPLSAVLSEIEGLSGEERYTAREFMTVLENGLAALEIAMIPQSSDAVFIGDATESKFMRVSVLFCLGADESLPRLSNDTAVITDGEIKRLSALSVEIEPQIDVVNRRAKESLYFNLCSFEKELYVSCPLRLNGEEARRGEAFLYIDRMCFGAPMSETLLYKSCERAPAMRTLLRLRDELESGKEESGEAFASLKAMLAKEEGEETVGRLLSEDGKKTSAKLADLLFRGPISPSLLETYFGCPYKSFVSFALRLREREERTALDTDTGSFVHTVLEKTAPFFNEIESEEVCRELAERTAEELLTSPRYAFLADTGAGAYTGRRLVKECGAVTAACYKQVRYSAFSVSGTERDISLPALGLKGRTDRVDVSDEYVRVIDYKTGEIDDKPAAYYTGRKLQLQLYLLAVSEGKLPAGAFYFPAQEQFAGENDEPFRMKGFFVKDESVLSRMDTLRTEGKSAFFEGGGRSEKGLSQEEFSDFLHYALLVSQKAVGEMKEGNIAPSPYEGTCNYCKYKGMCGFSGESRKEASVTCAQIAAIVKAERGGE